MFFISYNKMSVQEKLTEYINLTNELKQIRKNQLELKKKVKELEDSIKEYMISNDMDSISLKEGEIILYSKKIPQTFKKESIVEKLTEQLNDTKKAEQLTESILGNKKFVMEEKVKAVIRKKRAT
jgi:hypothetical protein